MYRRVSVCVPALLAFLSMVWAESPPVAAVRAPDSGIQPQATLDAKGQVHLIYFKGAPNGGDIFYVVSADAGATWSKALRVNSQPGSAVATGNVRGAHLAVGREGRAHVAWMGSSQAQPKAPGEQSPMLYARLNDSRDAFEAQRNVMQVSGQLDGGGSIAADGEGRVFVVWHGSAGLKGETNRQIFLARSTDDGKTFSREVPSNPQATGVCPCCGMRAFADAKGNVHVLYRAAIQGKNRDMIWLVSNDQGTRFQGSDIHPWQAQQCMMSTAVLSEGPEGVVAAWETEAQVYFASLDPQTGKRSEPVAASGMGKGRKHPAIAVNAQGDVVLAWTEGMGWKKGGSLHWQVYSKEGKAKGAAGQAAGVPAWSLVTAFAKPDGSFIVIY